MSWAGFFVAVVLSVATYFGAYYVLLDGKRWDRQSPTAALPLPGKMKFVPHYRLGGPAVKILFSPANQLDRILRRPYWTTLEGWDELQPEL